MSYYFCIVGTRDNPLFEADLTARTTASLGPSSFFSGGGGGPSSSVSGAAPPSASSSASSAFRLGRSGASGSAPSGSASGSSSSAASSAGGASTSASSATSESSRTSAESGREAHGPGHGSTGAGGSVFGFGTALGALAGGLSSLASSSGGPVAGGGGGGGGVGPGAATHAHHAGARGHGAAPQGRGLGFGRYNDKDVLQMIAHSSLDAIDDMQFFNGAMYMKSVDRINEWTTSAFLIPGNVKFLILHEHKHDDGIRNFFLDVWELWVKITMNPFRDLNDPIRSASFDHKVRASARRYL